jgi:hypothetical protein
METSTESPLNPATTPTPPAVFKLNIRHQESYSRGELLLRTIFGLIYIQLPHLFLLAFFNIWSAIVSFIAWWVILFTGRYPESFFEYNVKMIRWQVRLNARTANLADGYPAFGIDGADENTSVIVPYPESLSRGLLLARAFFGFFYILIPHGFALLFRSLWSAILGIIGWWAVLFTGKYPQSIFEFRVGTIRWTIRLSLYLKNMTDIYPPFSGKE